MKSLLQNMNENLGQTNRRTYSPGSVLELLMHLKIFSLGTNKIQVDFKKSKLRSQNILVEACFVLEQAWSQENEEHPNVSWIKWIMARMFPGNCNNVSWIKWIMAKMFPE